MGEENSSWQEHAIWKELLVKGKMNFLRGWRRRGSEGMGAENFMARKCIVEEASGEGKDELSLRLEMW